MRNFAAMQNLIDRSTAQTTATAPAGAATHVWTVGVGVLLALPWLNPFAPGPSPSAVPLLFSWICAALALLALTLRGPDARGADPLRALALGWILAAVFNALIGLLQYSGASAQGGVWLNQTGPGEAFGNLRQRNQYATLMAIGLASAVWWTRQTATRPIAIWMAALAAVLGAGSAASSSRTGLLQWGLLSFITLFWLRGTADRVRARRVSWVVLSALLAYGLAMLVLPWLIGRDPLQANALARLQAGDTLCASRLTLWRNVLHLISLRPWTGWGWGELDYAHFITLYSGPRFCDILDNAHNLPLQVAVELGLPAALLLCGAAGWLIWRARPWRESCIRRQLAWAVLAVIGLHSLLEYPLWYGPFQTAALASLSLLCWPAWRVALARWPHGPAMLRQTARLLALLTMLVCATAAWDYRVASQIYLPPEQRAADYRDDTLARSQGIWLYTDQLRFAELTTADLNPGNANRVRALALQMLHFSPEARVVRLLLESDQLLGRTDELAFYAARFKAAFPADYARWQSPP